jgi:replicative DNA helicase
LSITEEIARSLRLFITDDDVFELRALNCGHQTRHGFYDAAHIDQAAGHVAKLEAGRSPPSGIYLVVNPLLQTVERVQAHLNKPLHRAGQGDGAHAEDVSLRRWFLVDVDPVRPAEFKDDPATEEESQAARAVASAVEGTLALAGLGNPICTMSGSGYQLAYPIDLPNDEDSRCLLRDALAGLGQLHNTALAVVDHCTHDASRLWKLPGTMAKKGDHTKDRPHRRARVVWEANPQRWNQEAAWANTTALRELVASWPSPDGKAAEGGDNPFRQRATGDSAREEKYGEAALRKEAAAVACATAGDRNNQLNKSAFALGQLVGGGVLERGRVEVELTAAALQAGLDHAEIARTIQSGIDAGMKEPRTVPDPTAGGARQTATPPPRPPGYRFNPMTSAEFDVADFRLTWLVKRLLVELEPTIIGGPRKSLKTSLAADLALSLGTGTPFLGEFDVYRKCRVAFLSGESGGFVLRKTARRICAARGIRLADADVIWHFDLPKLSSPDDMGELVAGLQRHAVEVLMVDPLYLCLLAGQTERQAGNLFDMGELLRNISRACLGVGCTPLLSHHATKRTPAGEPIELDDLAFAGTPEFAAQWILVNRRVPFDPGSGLHQLWMSVGGRAGQSGLWGVDVEEGHLAEDFTGQKWDVRVSAAEDIRAEKADARSADKKEKALHQDREDDDDVMRYLDRLKGPDGVAGYNQVRDAARLNDPRMTRAVLRLKGQGLLEEVPYAARIGSRATRSCKGLRRTGATI